MEVCIFIISSFYSKIVTIYMTDTVKQFNYVIRITDVLHPIIIFWGFLSIFCTVTTLDPMSYLSTIMTVDTKSTVSTVATVGMVVTVNTLVLWLFWLI